MYIRYKCQVFISKSLKNLWFSSEYSYPTAYGNPKGAIGVPLAIVKKSTPVVTSYQGIRGKKD
jgi:hypothetical protein